MLTKFWEGLGGELATKGMTHMLAPAFAFWSGGLLAYVWRFGRTNVDKWLQGRDSIFLGALVVATLLLLAASNTLVQRLEWPLLRWLEGYWPNWLSWLRRFLIKRQQAKQTAREQQWQALAAKGLTTLPPAERQQYAQLDQTLRLFPASPNDMMPTRLGNYLRAAETWPRHKYGLDAVICWPRLWLLLPDNTRQDLAGARAALNQDVEWFTWALLFAVWAVLTWWALIPSIVAMILAYRAALQTATQYGSLIEATFDVHRTSLYQALRFPLPTTPAEELVRGVQLTEYLWRGGSGETPKLLPVPAKKED
ncbi:MAG: hypothetical protein KDE56_01870 [Anaerolineales bacterium]|nr:hypothetical protein [Anaerolineales bacterium]